MEKKWQLIKNQLKGILTEIEYERWITPLHIIPNPSEKLVLYCHCPLTSGWAQKKYGHLIEALLRLGGDNSQVQFLVEDPQSEPQHPKEKAVG